MIILAIVASGVVLAFALALLAEPDETFPGSFLEKPENVTEHCHKLRIPPPPKL